MAQYVALLNWTEQGIKNAKDTTGREKAFADAAKKLGITVKSSLWTMGRYDLVVTLEGPNDEAVTALMIQLGGKGNARSETLRAFSASEMEGVLAKV